MNALLTGLQLFQSLLRTALFWSAAVLLVIAAVDWLVRTRRLGPFSPVSRFFRRHVDPLLVPVERHVVRLGGLPASAPWWALAGLVVGGILLLTGVDFVTALVVGLARGISGGPRGLAVLAVEWTFGILQIAVLVTVVVSWLPVSRYSPWVRWAFTLSEPILRFLRRLVPPFGSIDITPILAFFLLAIVQSVVLGALR